MARVVHIESLTITPDDKPQISLHALRKFMEKLSDFPPQAVVTVREGALYSGEETLDSITVSRTNDVKT